MATFRTGTDSPVRSDSSADRFEDQRSTASAGTRSPSDKTRMSSRTTSRPGMHPGLVRGRPRARRRRQDQDVFPDNVAPRNANAPPIANDERSWARQVAERFERPLGLARLIERNAHDAEHRGQKHQSLSTTAEKEIDRAAADEKKNHRLSKNFESNSREAPPFF